MAQRNTTTAKNEATPPVITETPAASESSAASMFALTSFDVIPPRNAGESRAKYPFAQMEPGHMFKVTIDPNDEKGKNKGKTAKRLSTAASQASKTLGKDFVVRTLDDTTIGVYCARPEDIAADAE